jgi:hypothetical protein
MDLQREICKPVFKLDFTAHGIMSEFRLKAGSLKMNTALEYSTRVVQEGGRRCKKSTLNDLVHLTPLRIPLMNPPSGSVCSKGCVQQCSRLMVDFKNNFFHYEYVIMRISTETEPPYNEMKGLGLIRAFQ